MSYFDHLDTAPEAAKSSAVEAPRFPCQSCAGTGRYRGVRIHQSESKCFACNGVGSFKTSHGDRMKARAKAADKKRAAKEAKQGVYNEANPGLIEWARNASHWNSFARDMIAAFEQWGELTDGQTSALYRSMEKDTARQAERKAAKEAKQADRTTTVDLGAIKAMFDTAAASGLKKMAYRAGGLVISPAKATGNNPGALYVKTKGGDYLGKVLGSKFIATDVATPEHRATLDKIAENPSQAAKDYGKETGTCSCCGRELSDPVSVEMGIGPICAEKWGL